MRPERIRVLRVIARLNIGGPAIHATLLTERLDPARFESRLVTGCESTVEGNYLALHGQRLAGVERLGALRRELHPARDAVALVALARIMRSFRPHVVHTHTAKAGTLGRLAARLAGVPVVVHTYHGHVLEGYFSPLATRAFLAIERAMARITTCLLTVTPQVRAALLGFGIGRADQVRVLPLGLDLGPLLAADGRGQALRRELGVGDAPLVGIVARLVPIKRHQDFLAAASLTAARIPDCRFLVVGDGERRAELEALARQLGIGDRVLFLGWRRDLPALYAALDAVALCSANEGSPVSLIEAMAAGRPVVATRVGGVPDLIDDGVSGLLVESGDVEGLAKAIVTVLLDPERASAMGLAGRKRVYPAFSADRLLADMDALYRELLGPVGA